MQVTVQGYLTAGQRDKRKDKRPENSQEVTFNAAVADLGVLCVQVTKGDSLKFSRRSKHEPQWLIIIIIIIIFFVARQSHMTAADTHQWNTFCSPSRN